MASTARSGFPARTNSRLDAFLRRHLAPEVYDAVRAYEPCIVLSDAEKYTFKYVVLSDRLIYLTENPPKSIRRVVALRDVVAIDLAMIQPSALLLVCKSLFLGLRYGHFAVENATADIVYTDLGLCPSQKVELGVVSPTVIFECQQFSLVMARTKIATRSHQENGMPFKDSTPCPSDFPSEIPVRVDGNRNEIRSGNSLLASPIHSSCSLEKEESELHLYVISGTSSIFLHLKSSWNNYIITSELFYFLVNKLHEYLPESRNKTTLHNKSQRVNELAGTLFNLLVILISKPNVPKSCFLFNAQQPSDSTSAEMSFDAQMVFVASIIKQVVDGLSASLQLLTPCQAVLLYQRLYILKSCLQYSKALAERIRNDHSEEFRYFICMPALEKRLPVWYPITEPTTQLCHEVLQLINMQNVRGD
ncbi:hypothetical protein NN561_008174 [Cricetulus griseus]